MEANDLRFEDVVTKLLEQVVVCEVCEPEGYRYLKDTHYFDQVDAYLHKIGRHLAKTQDGLGFYCAFNSLDNSKKRSLAMKSFESWVVDLEGIVEWLRLVRSIDKDSRPLVAGAGLSEAELLVAIEESSTLQLQLQLQLQLLLRTPIAWHQIKQGLVRSTLLFSCKILSFIFCL